MDARQLEHIRELFIKASEDDKWKLVANLYAQNEKLQEENRELKELAAMRNAVQYKPSSEQMQYFFPELELLVAEPEPVASRTVHVNAHDKAASRPRSVTSLPADTPVVVIDHTGDAPETKTENGVDYLRGDDRVVYKIAYVPARYIVEKHIWAPETTRTRESSTTTMRLSIPSAALQALRHRWWFPRWMIICPFTDRARCSRGMD